MSRRPPDRVPACCRYCIVWSLLIFTHALIMRQCAIWQFRPSVSPSVGSGHAGVVAKSIVEILFTVDSHTFMVSLELNVVTTFDGVISNWGL